jgi:hypothetical protein
MPKDGMEGTVCAFEQDLAQGACAAIGIPASVTRPVDRARSLVRQSARASAARQRKLLRRAAAMLRKAQKAVVKAERRKAALPPECASALRATLAELAGRLAAVQG